MDLHSTPLGRSRYIQYVVILNPGERDGSSSGGVLVLCAVESNFSRIELASKLRAMPSNLIAGYPPKGAKREVVRGRICDLTLDIGQESIGARPFSEG